jgi:hypothetical protein
MLKPVRRIRGFLTSRKSMTPSSGENDTPDFRQRQLVDDYLSGIFMVTHIGSFPPNIPSENPIETHLTTGVPLAIDSF